MESSQLIYLVEDDPITALVTEAFIKRSKSCQCKVAHYADGQQAFDQLSRALRDEARIPDLILLDLNMPFMDGWDFLDACAGLSAGPAVPVVILTSSIRPHDIERARRYENVKGYFSKPLDDAKVGQLLELLGARPATGAPAAAAH